MILLHSLGTNLHFLKGDKAHWLPAFAGMTRCVLLLQKLLP